MRVFRFLCLIFPLSVGASAQSPSVTGSWEATLKAGVAALRLRVHVAKNPDGSLSGKMDSPDQNAKGLPLSAVTAENGVFKWELKMANASFEGKLNEAGTEIAGTFKQGAEYPLAFRRWVDTGEKAGRPQDPKPPLPYRAEDVTFPSQANGVTLAGTLTVPPGKGPFPAVALITSSGPQDRDEALMGHKPFLVLSDYLTRQGIAVLRYDDRGIGKSTGSLAKATTADFSDDAEGAFLFLKARPEIDPKRIGLAGHSEGGVVAPMVAARRADVAFIVLLAGTGVPGAEVILEQGQKMAALSGVAEAGLKAAREKQRNYYAIFRESKDDAELEKRLKEFFSGAQGAEALLRQAMSPWFRYFLSYDPEPTLEKVKCPVLVVNGEKDVQVLPDQNLPAIEAALKKGGNTTYKIVRLPGLNHLFQTAETGMPAEYGRIEETMSPVMLETVARWIRQQTGLE